MTGPWSKKGEIKCTYVDLPKQLENGELKKNNILTNYARFTGDIKSKIAIANAAFNKKNATLIVTVEACLRKKLAQ